MTRVRLLYSSFVLMVGLIALIYNDSSVIKLYTDLVEVTITFTSSIVSVDPHPLK